MGVFSYKRENRTSFDDFLVLFFTYLLTMANTGLIGPMSIVIAQNISTPTQTYTYLDIATIAFVCTLVSALVSIVWSSLENRISRKSLIICSTCMMVVPTFLLMFTRSFGSFFLNRLIYHIGAAAIIPLVYSYTMDAFPVEGRSKAFGLLGSCIALGFGFGGLLGGILVSFVDWRIPYLIVAILTAFNGMVLFMIKEPKRGAQESELAEIIEAGGEYQFGLKWSNVVKIFQKKANWLIFAYIFLHNICWGPTSFYIITMMVDDFSFSSHIGTVIGTFVFAPQILGGILLGQYANKKFNQRKDGKVISILHGFAISFIPLIIGFSLNISPDTTGLIVLFCLTLAVGSLLLPTFTTLAYSVMGDINPPEMRATLFSLNSVLGGIAIALGIWVYSLLISALGAIHLAFLVMSFLFMGSMLLFLPLRKIVPQEMQLLGDLLKERAKEIQGEIPK